MNCGACSPLPLRLFLRSFTKTKHKPFRSLCSGSPRSAQLSQFHSTARPLQPAPSTSFEPPKPFAKSTRQRNALDNGAPKEKPVWQVQKESIKAKLGGAAWSPRKKLSPDTMEGIRHLHQTQPDRFTTPILAQHFKVSPEAIRRILKSNWRPTDAETEARLRRWDKRGEKIWSNLVELGVKPPKKWREMGVGSSKDGSKPKWKSRVGRNMVPVNESVTVEPSIEELIPIVDGKEYTKQRSLDAKSLADRLGV